MVGGIVLIDVGIMVAWEIEDPLEWAQQNFTERVSKEMKTVLPNVYGSSSFYWKKAQSLQQITKIKVPAICKKPRLSSIWFLSHLLFP